MAYTNDWNAVFDRVATFVDRILKGARPADLPVELPRKIQAHRERENRADAGPDPSAIDHGSRGLPHRIIVVVRQRLRGRSVGACHAPDHAGTEVEMK